MAFKTLTFEELKARREQRRKEEVEFAMRRPKIPNSRPEALTIMILQWAQDNIYADWRARELEKAQATKEVLSPKGAPRRRGGRKNSVLEQLGL